MNPGLIQWLFCDLPLLLQLMLMLTLADPKKVYLVREYEANNVAPFYILINWKITGAKYGSKVFQQIIWK